MYEVFNELDGLRSRNLLPFVDRQWDPLRFFRDLSEMTGVSPGVILSSTIHTHLFGATQGLHSGTLTDEELRQKINEIIGLLLLARFMIDRPTQANAVITSQDLE